jgi:hypothetical protein
MKLQENPDGLAGHEERECIRMELYATPAKRKFTSKGHKMRWFSHVYEDRKSLEAAWLPVTCPHYKIGCTFANCPNCKIALRGQDANRVRDTNGATLIKLLGEL